MIDIHSHDFSYKGPIKHITCGYDIESSKKAMFVGIAPQSVPNVTLENIEQIGELVPERLGVGEIGMDYKWAKTPEEREKQEEIFIYQLDIAIKYKKPIQIHCRECYDEILELLDGYNGRVLFHFFSGTLDNYKKILDNGWYISIPPVPSSKRKKAVLYSLDGIITETDSPYVGKSPEDVKKSLLWISSVIKKPFEDVEQIVDNNAYSYLGKRI